MIWREAWNQMLYGKHIKLPSWGGYWAWEDGKDGKKTIMIHRREGTVMDIRETDDPAYTFSNIASAEWMVDDREDEKIDISLINRQYQMCHGFIDNFESDACTYCSNNPKNGGSGNCCCSLGGSVYITC